MKQWLRILVVLSGISLAVVGSGHSQESVSPKSPPQDGRPQIQHIIERLHSKNPAERVNALGKLKETGTQAVSSISSVIPLLGDTEAVPQREGASRLQFTDVAAEAVKALVDIGQPAVGPLIQALKDKNSVVRAHAVEALGEIGDIRAEDPLMTVLAGDEDGTVRAHAAEALGKIGDSRALKALTVALGDRKSKVQESAGDAIRNIINTMKKRRELTPLRIALKSTESVVRRTAAQALMELKDPRTVDALIDALNDSDAQVRKDVMEALKGIGKPAVVPLAAFLRDDNPSLCKPVIKLLGEIGDKSAVGHLVGVLKHFRSSQLRCEAADALGKIKDERIVGSLIEALSDRSLCVREAAAKSLKEVGEPAVEPLIASLRDENYDVCFRAIVLLGEIGDKRAVEPLVAVLKNFELWALRFEAAKSLGMIKDSRAVEPLVEALSDKDETVREGAQWALKEIIGEEYKAKGGTKG